MIAETIGLPSYHFFFALGTTVSVFLFPARYHDYNLLMLLCMMSGILVIFCNIVSQTINEQIDPRMKDEVITEKSEVVEG